MTLKNVLKPNHSPVNKYKLSVSGLPALVLTKAGGVEQETGKVTLPDKTWASSGEQEPFEIECELPLHHTSEVAAIEKWYKEGKHPVQKSYKKTGTMIYKAIDDSTVKSLSLIGAGVTKIKYPDEDMSDTEGAMNVLVFTLTVDDYKIL
jgi:hypothetical protein